MTGGGKTVFLRSYALARQLPLRIQQQLGITGQTESPFFVIESEREASSRYFFAPEQGERQEITNEVKAEREAVADTLQQALSILIEPDIIIDNREVFYLHRQQDGQDIYFLVNPTYFSTNSAGELAGSRPADPLGPIHRHRNGSLPLPR